MKIHDYKTGNYLGTSRRINGRKYKDENPEGTTGAVKAKNWLSEGQLKQHKIEADQVIYFQD